MIQVTIKSFNGIGDALFMTPTLRRIKEAYKNDVQIEVNTNFPILFKDNPFVDILGASNKRGIFLGYPDPIHAKLPTCHHIISDWKIICEAFGLKTHPPDFLPEIYLSGMCRKGHRKGIGVQVIHKNHWHGKKVWPFFDSLALKNPHCSAIPKVRDVGALIRTISSFKLVVCAEGGISHIARALGVPAIVIYGGFARPEWNGYDFPYQINVVASLECSPCYNSRPCTHKIKKKCMKDISIGFIEGEIEKIFSG